MTLFYSSVMSRNVKPWAIKTWVRQTTFTELALKVVHWCFLESKEKFKTKCNPMNAYSLVSRESSSRLFSRAKIKKLLLIWWVRQVQAISLKLKVIIEMVANWLDRSCHKKVYWVNHKWDYMISSILAVKKTKNLCYLDFMHRALSWTLQQSYWCS